MPLEKPRGLDLAAMDRTLSKRDTTIRNDASQAFDQALHDNTRTGDVSETVFHHLVARHNAVPTLRAFEDECRKRFGDQPWFIADMVSYVYDDVIQDDDIRALKRRTERSTNGKAKATKRTAPSRNGKVKAGRSAERWRTLNNFVDVYARELPPFARDVWLVLFRDSTEGIARVGQVSIATRLRTTTRTVRRAISELVKRGFVDVVKLGQKNCGPSIYRVHLPASSKKK